MEPEALSHQLRQGEGPHLARRRAIVGLSLAAAGSMGVISLYQMGLTRHVPEPPLPYLDADKVDASAEAYEKLSMPDALIGLTSYGVTAMLAGMGGQDRARTRPWIPLALAAKAGADAAQAAKLTYDQWAKHKAFCSWCLLAAACTFVTAALVVPEALEAARRLGVRTEDEAERRAAPVAQAQPEPVGV